MQLLKSAKIYLCFAVFLFVAKPFLGFTMFSRMHPPAIENIFSKAFSKRKVEYSEDSNFNMGAIQKKLADPVEQFFLRITFLLCMLFPAVFAIGISINNRFLRDMQLSIAPPGRSYILNSNLLI
jgi:hypothetical protein